MRRILPVIFAPFLLVVVVSAQTKRPMTPEDVVSLNRASDPQMSPDARRVAFVVSSWDHDADRFNSDIWLVDEMRQVVRLTSNPKRDDSPRWSPEARRIAFLSERAADADAGAQIFMINPMGGEPVQLTSHKAPIQSFEWSPDGRSIAFIAEEAREKPRTKPPVVVDEDHRFAQLWVVDAASREIKQLTRGARHITAFNWSPDGSRIVFTARATPKMMDNHTTEVFVTPASLQNAPHDTAQSKQVAKGGGAENQPRFSPDGRWISYLAHADGDPNVGPERIHVVAVAGGEPRVLATDFDGYINSYRWVFDSRRVVFLAALGLDAHLYTMNIADPTPMLMTRNEGVTTAFSMTVDGMNITYVHESPRMATEVALLNARNMIPILLTRLNPQVESLTLGQVEDVKWNSNDGTEIEGVLVYPVGYQTGKRYPMLTYIHGGPEGAYMKGFNASWSAFPQVYAGAGYAVFMPNFRGSSNYGAKFALSNTGLVGKIDYEDILSGVDHLIKIGLADENKLAVAGWSYGGYMSAWIIGHTDRFKCAAFGAGLSNAVSYWGTADIVQQRERLHGGTPWEARKTFDEQSPLNHLTKVKTPALIFHGEKDERVPLGQSLETYRRLKRLGVTTRLVIYPDQGHGITVPGYQLDKAKREFEWIEKHTAGTSVRRTRTLVSHKLFH
ncbi:MAG: S9 family peptidase [Acidobacteria bacterium]|nr:S9 family peptidase [Acidobacteriota bacterium]